MFITRFSQYYKGLAVSFLFRLVSLPRLYISGSITLHPFLYFPDGLKDAEPDPSFVMLQNTEHMEEIYRPLSVPSVNDVLTGEKIVEIEQATVGQAENPLWHGIRKGRITASNFCKVKTKVESLRKAGINTVNAKKLVASLIDEYTPPGDIPALKYGRGME